MEYTDQQPQSLPPHSTPTNKTSTETQTTSRYRVIRRNGQTTDFDLSKIKVAVTKAFLSVEGGQAAASTRVRQVVERLSEEVFEALFRRMDEGGTVHIEDIQDQVELAMMRAGEHKAARNYVLYREKQSEKRAKAQAKAEKEQPAVENILHVIAGNGEKQPLDMERLETVVVEATRGLNGVNKVQILTGIRRNLFDGMAAKDVNAALVMTARGLIEKDPNYSYVSARLLMDGIRREALSFIYGETYEATQKDMQEAYPEYFKKYLQRGIGLNLLDPELGRYDLDKLVSALKPER